MNTRIIGYIGAALVLSCGGSDSEIAHPVTPADPVTQTPPDMPPSTASAAPTSDNVPKGMKALDASDLLSAKAYFDAALKQNPKDVDALYYLGYTAEKSGDKAAAEKAYRDALKLRSDHEGAALNLSGIDDEAQKYDDAALVCKAALAKHPDNPALHLNLAIALAGKGDEPKATKEFDDSLRVSGNDPMFHLVYGHWLGVWKKPDAALTQLRAARPLASDNLGVLASIGHEMHAIRAFSDCVPTFDKAIAMKDAAELRTERAACKLGAKDEAGAIVDLQAAVTSEPSYAPAHYYLGGALAQKGQFKQAIAEYEAFLKLAPTGPLAKAATEHVRLAKQRLGGK